MRGTVVPTSVGVMVIISVVPVAEEVRVPWAVYVAEIEEEGGDIIVGVPPTLVTVEAEVMDEVTFRTEVRGVIAVMVAVGLSVMGVVVLELVKGT